MSDDGSGRPANQREQWDASAKLVATLEGLGELRLDNGQLIGMRAFDIQVWEHLLEMATPQGPLTLRGNETVNVTVTFHGDEAVSFFTEGRPLTLRLENERVLTLTLKTAAGDLRYHGGLG